MLFETFQLTEGIVYVNFFSRNFNFFCNSMSILNFNIAPEVSPFDVLKIHLIGLRTLD